MTTICLANYFNSFKRLVAAMTILAMTVPSGLVGVAQGQGRGAAGNYVWQMVGSGQLSGSTDPQQFEGYEFTPGKDGFITELCGFSQGTHAVDLYDSSFNLLASATLSSYEQWNCAAITPVVAKKQNQYYVIAEIFSGSAFKQAASLPQVSGDVSVISGVTQPVTAGFGQKLKNDTGYVFGLVDVKFSSDSKDALLLRQASASLASSAAPTGQPAALAGGAQTAGGQGVLRNCASGKCIVCGTAGCQIADDQASASQAAPTFIQTCAAGSCFSCTSGNCAKTDATGIVKTGYSYKNCSQNKCLTCVNGDCITTGGSIPKYTYAGNGMLGYCVTWKDDPPGPRVCIDWWINDAHSFSEWLDAEGWVVTGDISSDAILQDRFLADFASILSNSSGLNAADKTFTNPVNGSFDGITFNGFSVSLPSLPGAVTTNNQDAQGTKATYDNMLRVSQMMKSLAGTLAQKAPDSELAKNIAQTGIDFGVNAAKLAQNYINANGLDKAASKDNSFKSNPPVTSNSPLLVDTNENAVKAMTLFGVTLNKGQVVTDESGAPVQNLAVQQSMTIATSGIKGPSDVFTTAWGKMPSFGNLPTTVTPDQSMVLNKSITDQKDIPVVKIEGLKDVNGKPATVGSQVSIPNVNLNSQAVSMSTKTLTQTDVNTGYVQLNVMGTPTIDRNGVAQPVTMASANNNLNSQQTAYNQQTAASQPNSQTAAAGKTTPQSAGTPTSLPIALTSIGSFLAADGKVVNNNLVANQGVTVGTQVVAGNNQVNPTGIGQATGSQVVGYTANGVPITAEMRYYGYQISPTGEITSLKDANSAYDQQQQANGGIWVSNDPDVAACDSVRYGSDPNPVAEFSENGGASDSSSGGSGSSGLADVIDTPVIKSCTAQATDATGGTVKISAVTKADATCTYVINSAAAKPLSAGASQNYYDNVPASSFNAGANTIKVNCQSGTKTDTCSATYNSANITVSGAVTSVLGATFQLKDASGQIYSITDYSAAKIVVNDFTVNPKTFRFTTLDTSLKISGTINGTTIIPTQIVVTRVPVKVICPSVDICVAGDNAPQTTIDYANNGVIPLPGWTWIPAGSTGPIGVPLSQNSLELRFATLSLKDLASGASASLISALDKNDPQSPVKNNPPQIVNYQPRFSDGKDVTISLQTDEPSTCKYSPYDLPWAFMWNTMDTKDGLTHASHVGAQAPGAYIYYAQCQNKLGLGSDDYTFVYSVDKNYDPRVEGDKTAPAVANIGVLTPAVAQGAAVGITAKIGDNVGVGSALAQIKNAQGQYLAVLGLTAGAQGNTFGYQWDTTSRPAGQYQITLVADDLSGNFSRSDNAASFAITANPAAPGATNNSGICKPLVNNGAASDKVDVVFVPCGFGSDMASFEMAAQSAADKMLSVAPLSDNKQKFNIVLAKTPGLTCAETLSSNMDNDAVRFRETALPCDPDVVVVLKKSGQDGGISLPGSRIAFILASDPFLAAHEIGHAFFRLNDEYSYGCTATDLSASFNCDNSPKCDKWKDLPGTKCVAGCTCEGNYRSAVDSVMVDPRTATGFSPAASQHILDWLKAFK